MERRRALPRPPRIGVDSARRAPGDGACDVLRHASGARRVRTGTCVFFTAAALHGDRPAERRSTGLRVETDDRLIEIGHGTWEGRYREDIAREDPERYRLWREEPARVAFEGGETLDEVLIRWRAFAHELASRVQPALVTTHDAVLRCALLELLGRPLKDFWNMRVENGAFALIESDGQRLSLISECDTAHLSGLRAEVSGQAL